jgi:secondary thiamine-phosphate synthase enzyme
MSLYEHHLEGPDDMPAHIKCALIGTTINIPITDGKLNLGTWQGIWLLEHKNGKLSREIVITAHGI